jgi:putative endonuclease
MNCAVYLLASQRNGTLYTGVTSGLVKRVYEHKHDLADGFTKRHGVKMLVWYELTTDITSAIQREKQIKKWNRLWKLRLVDQSNPEWRDLYSDIVG